MLKIKLHFSILHTVKNYNLNLFFTQQMDNFINYAD